jgi:hypothetical protein
MSMPRLGWSARDDAETGWRHAGEAAKFDPTKTTAHVIGFWPR